MSTRRRWDEHLVEPVGVLGQPAVGEHLLLDQHGQECREQVGVTARPWAEVDVGELGRLGAPRVDDDQRAARVVGDLLEDPAGLWEPVRLPRVLAPEHGDLGVLVVARGVAAGAAEQLPVDPELAGLLLGERVRGVADAERSFGRGAVATAEVVPLPAAAVIEDLLAAVLRYDVGEAGRHFGDRGVPVDRFERAVVAAAQGRGQALWITLVVVDAQALLARVALRAGVCLVAAHTCDRAAVEPDLEPAVDRAQHTRRGMPVAVGVAHSRAPPSQ